MADGLSLHLRRWRGPRRPTHWPTRRTSVLCPKLGGRWSNSWMAALPVRVDLGLCSTWRAPLIPGYRTLCPLTWTSGGHSSSWLESPTVHNGSPGTCCHGEPLVRRGPWCPVYLAAWLATSHT